jgi:hypothetical protein
VESVGEPFGGDASEDVAVALETALLLSGQASS